MDEPCRLCGEMSSLQNSHVLPAFVFRWLKDSGASEYLRSAQHPNKRVQDGITERWLCRACEQRLGSWETDFATHIFHPFLADPSGSRPYREFLSKFAASLAWRIATLLNERGRLSQMAEADRALLSRAMYRWGEFIKGTAPHPERFEQHLFVFSEIASTTVLDLPGNMNRYLWRGVELDIATAANYSFTYAKLGPFAFFGFFKGPGSNWKGGKLSLKRGVIAPASYLLPSELLDYLKHRARNMIRVHASMSDRQHRKLEEYVRANPDRFLSSETFRLMRRDVEMFGERAFREEPTKE